MPSRLPFQAIAAKKSGGVSSEAVMSSSKEIHGTWRLQREQTILGEIIVKDADFPWLTGIWVPTSHFEEVRGLFDAELALVESDQLGNEWEALYQRIREAGVRLHYPDGGSVPEFLLHIKNDEAWRSAGAMNHSRLMNEAEKKETSVAGLFQAAPDDHARMIIASS